LGQLDAVEFSWWLGIPLTKYQVGSGQILDDIWSQALKKQVMKMLAALDNQVSVSLIMPGLMGGYLGEKCVQCSLWVSGIILNV
jgi:hypothetical protein